MWKRIHSNRDPGDTVFSELKKEFSVYFGAAGKAFRHFAGRFPKTLFGIMLVLMTVSLVLSFTVFRHPEPVKAAAQQPAVNTVGDGFGQIMLATEKIRKTIRLKKIVDSIAAKRILSAADSTALDSALTALQRINSFKN